MILRMILGASLFALGYYIGKEIGRTEPIRDSLEKSRQKQATSSAKPKGETSPAETTD